MGKRAWCGPRRPPAAAARARAAPGRRRKPRRGAAPRSRSTRAPGGRRQARGTGAARAATAPGRARLRAIGLTAGWAPGGSRIQGVNEHSSTYNTTVGLSTRERRSGRCLGGMRYVLCKFELKLDDGGVGAGGRNMLKTQARALACPHPSSPPWFLTCLAACCRPRAIDNRCYRAWVLVARCAGGGARPSAGGG
jgi:hypothetical protein